ATETRQGSVSRVYRALDGRLSNKQGTGGTAAVVVYCTTKAKAPEACEQRRQLTAAGVVKLHTLDRTATQSRHRWK
ncbi:hypothetical protein BaRGS_00036670, partial [Batillaria attramentaria]